MKTRDRETRIGRVWCFSPAAVFGAIAGALWCFALCGCKTVEDVVAEVDVVDVVTTTTTTTTTTTIPETTETTEAQNGFAIAQVQWLGKGCADTIGMTLKSASVNGSKINLSFEKYSWPTNGDGGCDAIICMFRKLDGTWKGGKFDWIRTGGQSVKLTENIEGGYGGHTTPADGETVAFMFMSVDYKQRSNAVFCQWK